MWGVKTKLEFNPLQNTGAGDKTITLTTNGSSWDVKGTPGGFYTSTNLGVKLTHGSDDSTIQMISSTGSTATYDASGITQSRTYTLQNASGTLSLLSDLDNYLLLCLDL